MRRISPSSWRRRKRPMKSADSPPIACSRRWGVGGMGLVFQAEDVRLKRLVALKVMRFALADHPTARERFLREAQAAAAVRHDHVVTIYQVGEERGVPFLAMEFLEGESLDDRLQREGRLPVAEIVRIGREIAQGLAAAHQRGLIHRDIKPSNIWLEERGNQTLAPRVKVLDFGLARAAAGDARLTHSGAIVGTPAYMAPEQARGEPIDARCDLFSLGCVLYLGATGEAPFHGTDMMSTLLAVATQHPRPPQKLNPDLPAELSKLIVKVLAKDRAARPASAAAVVAALEAIDGAAVASPPRRRRISWGWVTLIAAALGGAVLMGTTFALKTPDGTLIVKVMEPDVEVVLDGEKKIVIDSHKMGRIELRPGDHELIVKRGAEEVFARRFTLKSGGQLILDAVWKEPDRPPQPIRAAKDGASPLDGLQASAIPAEKLLEEQPAELVAILGRPGKRVNALAFSSDGRRLLAAAADGQGTVVRLWDVLAGKEIHRYQLPPAVMGLALAPDGRQFVSCGAHQKPALWDVATGKEVMQLQGTGDCVYSIAFAPDGRGILAGDRAFHAAPGRLHWWDARTGGNHQGLAGHTFYVMNLAFFADGRRALSAGDTEKDLSVRLWDLKSGREVRRFEALPPGIGGIAVSPRGRYIAAGISPKGYSTARIWDLEKTDTDPLCDLVGHPGGAFVALNFSPDEKRLQAVDAECWITVFDVASRAKVLDRKLPGPAGGVAFAPDRRHVAISSNGTIWILRLAPPATAAK
jgi:WD40 repeat protein